MRGTMAETEQSIISDLDMLTDGLDRMEFILACAGAFEGISEAERRDDELVSDCQTSTWLSAEWKNDVLSMRADSLSLLVKGALSLLAEIYDGRSRSEINAFSCRLISYPTFAEMLNTEQKKGLESVIGTLGGTQNGRSRKEKA